MPIDQMQVAITRPLEEEVNSAPGLDRVVSITSRGSAEIDLFFTWNVDMFQNSATGERRYRSRAADAAFNRPDKHESTYIRCFPDHALQRHFRHDSTKPLALDLKCGSHWQSR